MILNISHITVIRLWRAGTPFLLFKSKLDFGLIFWLATCNASCIVVARRHCLHKNNFSFTSSHHSLEPLHYHHSRGLSSLSSFVTLTNKTLFLSHITLSLSLSPLLLLQCFVCFVSLSPLFRLFSLFALPSLHTQSIAHTLNSIHVINYRRGRIVVVYCSYCNRILFLIATPSFFSLSLAQFQI